jgi:glyoxylase-like metal-dependent hydrolase (beta-lactamase superfamily II)
MTTTPTPPLATGPWFTAAPMGDGLTLVAEPHADRFIRCNIWHVAGRDASLMIDTGLGVASLTAAPAVAPLLADRRTVAVATHSHYDHTGSLHEFGERWIHEAEVATVATSTGIGGSLRTHGWDPATLARLTAAGYAPPADGELLTAIPAGFDPDAYAVPGVSVTRVLHEADVIDLGDRSFEVLHLPGHSPGSIGLWDEERGVLFSGDAVYDGPLLDFGAGSDVDAYLATMDRLRRLPVTVVHGGHDPSFDRARLVELCEAYIDTRS